MLYPKESLTRELKNLSGMWNFKVDFDNNGIEKKWHETPLSDPDFMPVPASYNDITTNPEIRDHIGAVWYETFFYVNDRENKDVLIRFGSVTHKAKVWVNGNKVAENKGGYLPFEAVINKHLKWNERNRLTVQVDNILDSTILPPGEILEVKNNQPDKNAPKFYHGLIDPSILPIGHKIQDYFHDFFNYSGIHRPVYLIVRDRIYLEDITIKTDIDNNVGIVNYTIEIKGNYKSVKITLLDKNNKEICSSSEIADTLKVNNPNLWQPLNAYLYSIDVKIFGDDNNLADHYAQPFGIRTIKIKDGKFLINDKPFYFKGFGKHEDMDIKGKGLDDAINARDFQLLKWIGANSFRTSHYPYSEEILNLADKLGFVVIDESPAVGLKSDAFDSKPLLNHHLDIMEKLIKRDKNHPSVVMWSLANEPYDYEESAVDYFAEVAKHTRELDPERPITIVSCSKPHLCKIADLIDIICVNYYFSWYTTPGRLDVLEHQLEHVLTKWHELYDKPIIMAEYGAGAIAGFHSTPPAMFTEEYQKELLNHHHNVFDKLDFVIGEHPWNFADFATRQNCIRVFGNRKGAFTRQRQPKYAAHLLRKRWLHLENKFKS